MQIPAFLGIHNTVSRRTVPDNALTEAVNVDLSDSGEIIRRVGATQAVAVSVSASYQMENGRAFVVSEGWLCEVNDSLELIPLVESTATQFDDSGDVLFTNDGLMLNGEQVHRLAAMHSATQYPVVNEGSATELPVGVNNAALDRFTQPFPANVERVAWFESALYCAQRLENSSVIWYSKPFHYHLYDYEANYLVVPGQIVAMLRSQDGLCIGTTDAIYIYNGALNQVADYGVVPGRPMVRSSSGKLWIHSVKGACTIPFQNVTSAKVSLPPGRYCTTATLDFGGIERFVAVHDGGGRAHNRAF